MLFIIFQYFQDVKFLFFNKNINMYLVYNINNQIIQRKHRISTDKMKDVYFISEYERTFCVREVQRMKEIAKKAQYYPSWVISQEQLQG